jgi:hypothetical protein
MPQCANCGRDDVARFCPGCGQKVRDYRVPLGKLIADTIAHTFGLDSRIGRTVGPFLFRPGYLTKQHHAGRRTRYSSPWRIYLLASIVLVLAMTMWTGPKRFVIRPQTATIGLTDPDSRARPLSPAERRDLHELDAELGPLGTRLRKSIEAANADPSFSRTLVERFLHHWPKALFLLLPLLTLLLKLFYRRSGLFYSEHFILALHAQSFAFFAVAAPLAWNSGRGLLVALAVGTLYFFLALRKVYDQPWRITLLKFAGLGLCYTLAFALATLGTALVSML